MRPRPMNPQMAGLVPVDENSLLVTLDTVPAAQLSPSTHSLESENRTEMAALILFKLCKKLQTDEERSYIREAATE